MIESTVRTTSVHLTTLLWAYKVLEYRIFIIILLLHKYYSAIII